MYRYYITERPPMVGTIPYGAANVTAFEDRQLVTEIGREAYGYAEYAHRLHPQIMKEFELVPVITIKDWNIESVTGYKPLTTFYRDFSIADAFGIDAIEDTFFRSFSEWQSNYKYLTELVLVLNWKSFEHDDSGKSDYVEKYRELHEQLSEWCESNFSNEELSYYNETID